MRFTPLNQRIVVREEPFQSAQFDKNASKRSSTCIHGAAYACQRTAMAE